MLDLECIPLSLCCLIYCSGKLGIMSLEALTSNCLVTCSFLHMVNGAELGYCHVLYT